MATTPIPSCVATVPIFRVLEPRGLAEVGAALRHRHYDKGEGVAVAGDPVDHLLVVAAGRLKVVHSTAGGREQVVRTLGPGEFLGEMALFAPARHEGDLVALEPTEVCTLPRDAVQTLLHRHPDVAIRLVEALAQRLADRFFFETTVRLHRAGEGASYTGLKTDSDFGSGLRAADRALETGSLEEVYIVLDRAVREGVGQKYQAVLVAREEAAKAGTVAAARERAEAELMFETYIFELYQAAEGLTIHGEGAVEAGRSEAPKATVAHVEPSTRAGTTILILLANSGGR